MVKLTWLGEDELHGDQPGPSFNVWNGIKFPKGVAVEVDNAHMIAKARVNKYYVVSEEPMERKHEAQAQIKGEGRLTAQAEVVKKDQGTGYSPEKPKKKKPKAGPRADADPRSSDDAA